MHIVKILAGATLAAAPFTPVFGQSGTARTAADSGAHRAGGWHRAPWLAGTGAAATGATIFLAFARAGNGHPGLNAPVFQTPPPLNTGGLAPSPNGGSTTSTGPADTPAVATPPAGGAPPTQNGNAPAAPPAAPPAVPAAVPPAVPPVQPPVQPPAVPPTSGPAQTDNQTGPATPPAPSVVNPPAPPVVNPPTEHVAADPIIVDEPPPPEAPDFVEVSLPGSPMFDVAVPGTPQLGVPVIDVPSTVPEPTSLALTITGILGLAPLIRRQRR